jgi:DNA-binding NarL/FixJ family response regulator
VDPDVVVLNLGLPRLGDRNFRLELRSRADTRHVPIVVISGGDVSDLDPTDFASILRKPIGVDVLVEAVDKAIRKGAPVDLPDLSGAQRDRHGECRTSSDAQLYRLLMGTNTAFSEGMAWEFAPVTCRLADRHPVHR